MGTLRASCVLAAFLFITVLGIPIQWLNVKLRLPGRRGFPHRYHRLFCRIMGARIQIKGTRMKGGVLFAANHTGWLDIPTLSAAAPISFVAKREVNTWPFFSLLARLQRTVFISRDDRTKAGVDRDQIRNRLLEGDALIVFPEGTSTDGNGVLPFKSSLFGAAEIELGVDAQGKKRYVPVQPVSVAYVGLHGMPMDRADRPFFAWYGDMELVPHLWEAFKKGPLDVVIEFHPPMTMDVVGDRKRMSALCEAAVRQGVVKALTGFDLAPPHHDEDLQEELDGIEEDEKQAAE
jgi:lyso-ornithine lipid O-acyltransferase